MFILSEIQRTAKCIAPSKCIIRNISHFRFFQFSRKYFVFEASGKVDWPKIMSSNHYTADNFDRMWREDQEKKIVLHVNFQWSILRHSPKIKLQPNWTVKAS